MWYYPSPSCYRHVQDAGRAQNQRVVVGLDPKLVILILTFGLSVLRAADYTTLTLNAAIKKPSGMNGRKKWKIVLSKIPI